MSKFRVLMARLSLVALCLGLATAPATAQTPPPARDAVTYFDAAPGGAATVLSALRAEAKARRAAAGTAQVLVLQEIARPERLAMVERWTSDEAGVAGAAARAALGDRVARLLVAPPDVRLGLDAQAPPPSTYPRAAVVVLVHVDVTPDKLPDVIKALDARRQAARAAGAIQAEHLQQAGRLNHFAQVDAWADRAAFDRWSASGPAKDFRAAFSAIRGALYDERLYRIVP